MVTAIPQSAFNSPLLGDTTGSLTLRVQGTEHDGRILHIRSPKCLIGSDPSCTLRLRSTTVRPFHCLILRGTEGTFIRRWSPDTCLNGSGFDEARLSPGDRISIGAIELEVLPSASPADAPRGIAPPPENDPIETPQSESAQECLRLRDELDTLRQECERLQLAIQQQTQNGQETEASYRTLIEQLRSEIDTSQTVCRDQLDLRQECERLQLAIQQQTQNGQETEASYRTLIEQLRSEIDTSQTVCRDQLDLRQECERLQLAIQQQTQNGQETEASYRTLIEQLRSEIDTSQTVCRDQLAAHSSLTSQAEAAASQAEALQEELDGLRHQLQEELRLAGNSRGHLEAELEFRSQQLFDAQTQLAALQCTRDEQFAQWQAHEKQWHEELEATRAQGEAFQREIETLRFQATEAAARAADHEVSPPAAGDNAADIATWKDVAEGLRRELQQTRDEHRQVREEWHVDRQNLERELNTRSTAAQQLEQKYKQDMREAEVLIHAMQQEGKHLLIQLDEAKQSIRQGTEGNKKKRPSLVHTVRSLVVDGALPSTLAVTQVVPHSPPAEQPPVVPPEDPRPPRQSACPTMLMSSQLAFDEPESPPPPAAELPPVEPHVPTLALNPDDLPRVIVRPRNRWPRSRRRAWRPTRHSPKSRLPTPRLRPATTRNRKTMNM